jgi:probable selenium-dependent hydroxylase accessory protein YqeC
LFSEQFKFKPHTLVNFVGGGGKTALILQLLEEYSHSGPVLYTTTTRIHPPEPREGLVVISSDKLPLLKLLVEQIAESSPDHSYKLVITREFMRPNLLRGVPKDFDNTLNRRLFPILINEADGAASFSIKMPREGEPVLMENAEYLVPVIGLDCLNTTLGPQTFFRWQISADRLSLKEGQQLTPEIAAGVLMHRQGVCKDLKPGTTIIPFINKVDDPSQDIAARELALLLLHNSEFPVKQVVWGSVLNGRAASLFA